MTPRLLGLSGSQVQIHQSLMIHFFEWFVGNHAQGVLYRAFQVAGLRLYIYQLPPRAQAVLFQRLSLLQYPVVVEARQEFARIQRQRLFQQCFLCHKIGLLARFLQILLKTRYIGDEGSCA